MRSLGGMLAETYAWWLRSVSACCGLDEKPRQSIEKPIVVLRDQPALIPPPSAEPPWSSESAYEKTPEQERARSRGRSRSWSRGTAGTPWFSRSSSSRRRPKISGPSNFRHLHSESFQFPEPQPTQKRTSFRPLELNFQADDDRLSPLFPDFGIDDGEIDNQVTPPPRAHTANSSKWDSSSATLSNDRSYSQMSFHVPRRHVREGSVTSQEPVTPPRIPTKSRARACTEPSRGVDTIVERIASAMIEKERLQAEIESIIERQSLYISSRPSTAYGIPELEPMPSIPALPAAAPSFAERLSSDSRPHTAPAQAATSNMTPQERTLALAAAAFNSHPYNNGRTRPGEDSPTTPRSFRDDMSIDRPLAPPLPLVLRPPLRKKKSFSRVSSWLFPGGGAGDEHRREMSIDSVTNSPRPIRGGEGFYQCVSPPPRRESEDHNTDSSLSTWETEDDYEEEEEGQTVPTTTWSPGSSPVVQNTPRHTPIVERAARFENHLSASVGVKEGQGQGPRPTSVGVAF